MRGVLRGRCPMRDDEVARALRRKCGLCDAPRGKRCVSVIDGGELPGRIVHFYRLTPDPKNYENPISE